MEVFRSCWFFPFRDLAIKKVFFVLVVVVEENASAPQKSKRMAHVGPSQASAQTCVDGNRDIELIWLRMVMPCVDIMIILNDLVAVVVIEHRV